MPKIIFFSFIAIEVYLMFVFGGLWLLFWTIGGFFIGSMLVKRQGLSLIFGQQSKVNLSIKINYILAGILIFIPGLITDGIGILFLIPVIQEKLIHLLSPHLGKRFKKYGKNTYENDEGIVVEGEAKEKTQQDKSN